MKKINLLFIVMVFVLLVLGVYAQVATPKEIISKPDLSNTTKWKRTILIDDHSKGVQVIQYQDTDRIIGRGINGRDVYYIAYIEVVGSNYRVTVDATQELRDIPLNSVINANNDVSSIGVT